MRNELLLLEGVCTCLIARRE